MMKDRGKIINKIFEVIPFFCAIIFQLILSSLFISSVLTRNKELLAVALKFRFLSDSLA